MGMTLVFNATAALYSEPFAGGTIPDALEGGAVGVYFTGTVSDLPAGYDNIASLTITLNLSGGYNHDLYAYLVGPGGTLVTLFNQPGSVYTSGSGFDLTLGTSGPGIQTATQTEGAVFGGGLTYTAAGDLGNFNHTAATGAWTLYFQDLSEGGGSTTLNNWSLGIEAVPEPVNVALGIFGGVLGVAALRKKLKFGKLKC